VGQIKKKEETGVKRMNVNVPTDLHNSFKAAAAAQGLEMTVVLLDFIQKFVSKHAAILPRKSRRA
jgi:hypothetical protein